MLRSVLCIALCAAVCGEVLPAHCFTLSATGYTNAVCLENGKPGYGEELPQHRVVWQCGWGMEFETSGAGPSLLFSYNGGFIDDLGTAKDLAAKYQYNETRGYNYGFASIYMDTTNGTVVIAKTSNTSQPLDINTAAPLQVPAVPGHIYVGGSAERFLFKLQVVRVGKDPENGLGTIVWNVLKNQAEAGVRTDLDTTTQQQ